MTYACTDKECGWKGPKPEHNRHFRNGACPECGSPVENLDIEERIAIRVIDGGQDEEEAREKAIEEMQKVWEDSD